MSGPTYVQFGDWIERVWRELMPAQRPLWCQLTSTTTVGQTAITLTGALTSVQPGSILSVDMEEMFVISCDQNSGLTEVVPGYNGSTKAAHTAGVLCYIQARFTKWGIAEALNDDLADLSGQGLYQTGLFQVNFNPVYNVYDLTGVPTDYLRILEITYVQPIRLRGRPRIFDWEELRNQTDPSLPSGNAIVIRSGGFPGLPMNVLYAAPFTPLVNWTDPISLTGLPPTAYDLPPLGAQIGLVAPREISRNATEAQPDARKAPEVPAGAVANSTAKVELRRNNRIVAEANRLRRQHPERKPL